MRSKTSWFFVIVGFRGWRRLCLGFGRLAGILFCLRLRVYGFWRGLRWPGSFGEDLV